MNEFTGLEIAVVGLAARFPGAESVDAYWDMVAAGRPAISTFTDDELAAAGVAEDLRRNPSYVPAAGVLAGAEYFDHEFFGLSPRDSAVLDPQHRILLECAWHALEDAGYARAPERHKVGVYAAASFSTYLLRHLLPNAELMADLSPHEVMLSNDKDSLATHVAYHLNLTGPAISVQTACSASLVAVHLARQGLLSGDCDLALAGAVSVQPPQTEGYLHQRGSILSPDGTCRPFDAAAQGTLIGGGVGLVVLKRLADAIRDRDTVHAVLRGTAINNDGSGKVGFTAPSVEGQSAVIRSALGAAGVDAATVGYVEAHGTATALGDPIEVAGLTEAFRGSTDERGYCALGSVKALIGHTDTAAGVAGLIKAVLAVREGVLPPSPYFTEPNPALDLAETPFHINAEALPWPARLHPRRAGVSSFGMGGTNAHAVVEQPPDPQDAGDPAARPAELLLLSARDGDALARAEADLGEFLAGGKDVSLADAAHTLRAGRQEFAHRLAVVCPDRDSAVAALTGQSGQGTGGRWTGVVRGGTRREVAFLFPGQGAQHAGMACGLYEDEPAFRKHLDECADLLRPYLDRDLLDLIGNPDAPLDQTRYTQPALFAVEYALARLWQDWGVRPAVMLGHSVGEYVAACIAGVLDLPDALGLVAARGRLMQSMPAGSMLALALPAERVAALLDGGLCLAASNAPDLSVVAGPTGEIADLEQRLAADGVTGRRLHTSHAFHSAMMEPILGEFTGTVGRVRLRPPHTPFVSGATGELITAQQATDPMYWAGQLRLPVRFAEGVRTVLRDPDRVLLEVGPGTTLATLARRCDPGGARPTVLSSLSHPRSATPDGAALLSAAGRLWLAGAPLDPAAVGPPGRRVPLPGYPFARRRCWFDLPGAAPMPAAATAPPEPVPAAAEARPTAEVVAQVWGHLLGVPEVAPHDNFFELGGHSLLAIQVVARLTERLDIEMSTADLFEAQTVAELARLADGRRAAAPPDLLAEIGEMSEAELQAELDLIRAERETHTS